MVEIVGAKIGTIITNKKDEIYKAIQNNTITEFLDRTRMQFMAACDFGLNWVKMANGPTLFIIDDNSNPQAPNHGIDGRPELNESK